MVTAFDLSSFQVLLVSSDQALMTTVRRLADRHCCSLTVRETTCLSQDWQDFDFTLFHSSEQDDEKAFEFIVQDLIDSSAGRRVGFISDVPDPRRELSLWRAGAAHVFVRPLDLNRLAFALERQMLEAEAVSARLRAKRKRSAAPKLLSLSDLQSHASEQGILFHSGKMLRLMDDLRRVIHRDSNILISGETGTGKTQLAQLVHRLSPRREDPFVVANCAAMAPSLLESELFGHAKGAFTGATQAREGKLFAAGAGTLFLDEIDSLPPEGQQRLLRVLDQRVFEKVGSNTPQQFSARVIAAANRPLEAMVADGRFRSDLYYRLKVVSVDLPPLRDRPEDIAAIATHLIREEALREGDPIPEVTDDLLERLALYHWPGNIRELRNIVSQLVLFAADGPLTVDALPASFSPNEAVLAASLPWEGRMAPPPANLAAGNWLADEGNCSAAAIASVAAMRPLQFERAKSEAKRISDELRRNGHNRTKTAEALGISRTALYKKLKKLNLLGLS